MSDFSPRSSESSELQELQELLSWQRDADLGEEESRRLLILEANYPAAAKRFRQQVAQVGGLLKQIPVCSIDRSLFDTPKAIVVADSPNVARRSGSQRIVVGAVTSLLCAGLLFALVRKTETTDTAILAQTEVLHGTMEARVGIGGTVVDGALSGDVPLVADSMQMKVASDLPPHVLLGAAASANSDPATEPSSDSSVEADVQPLIQSDDWNVVVVRIDAKDRDEAMDQIQSIAKKAGLQLKGAAGHDESRWLGVVLASNVAGREDVVNAMEGVGNSEGYVTETPPANSQEALFIAAARESLKHPTRSELHHGKVFVALPSAPAASRNAEGPVVAASEEPKGRNSDSAVTAPAAVPSPAVDGSAVRSAKVSAKVVADVTLVVFEFSDAEKSGPNSSEQQI